MLTMMNKSENSIKYFGFFIKDNIIYLIMELCDCSLDQIITEKKLNAKEIKEILEQLNDVFKIMYENSIILRDINSENILIKKLIYFIRLWIIKKISTKS